MPVTERRIASKELQEESRQGIMPVYLQLEAEAVPFNFL